MSKNCKNCNNCKHCNVEEKKSDVYSNSINVSVSGSVTQVGCFEDFMNSVGIEFFRNYVRNLHPDFCDFDLNVFYRYEYKELPF